MSANAAAKMLPGRTAGEKADAQLSSEGVKVLAVSRAGDTPAQILAQTTLKKTGAPVLVLLDRQDPAGRSRWPALTPMLPSAKIDPFDPTTDGSPAIGDGKGLAATPDEVVASFADSVSFPSPATSKLLAVDPLTEQLRQSARAQSQALNNQGAFTQTCDAQGRHRRAAPQGRQGRHRLRPPRCATTRSPCARPQKLTPDQGADAADRHQADHDRGQR